MIHEARAPYHTLPTEASEAPATKLPNGKEKPKRQGREVSFPEVEPWPEPVDGAALLDEIVSVIRRYMVMPDSGPEACALWSVHAHAFDLGNISPFLLIKSPVKRCGKSRALRLLYRLVPRPLRSSNISGAAVYRTIEKYGPTLLIDEADSFAKNNEELRGILNSGHERENAIIVRTIPPDFEPRMFSTWAPKVFAFIGSLAETNEDRGVVIPMKRKTKAEKVEAMRRGNLADLEVLRRKVARWVMDHAEELSEATPDVPDSLDDRCADNWTPLLAIADIAGGHWPQTARRAALVLSGERVEEETETRVQLLADIAAVWTEDETKVFSADLVQRLRDLEGAPWSDGKHGLTQHGLASLLRGFVSPPKGVRIGGTVKKGYERKGFLDAFARYLPGQTVTALQPHTDAEKSADGSVTSLTDVTVRNREFGAPASQSNAVTAQEAECGDERGEAWESPDEEAPVPTDDDLPF